MMRSLEFLYSSWGILTLSALSALLLAASAPIFDVPYAVFFALVPLCLLAHMRIARRDFLVIVAVMGTLYGICILFPLTSLEGWWFSNSAFLMSHRELLWATGLFLVALLAGGIAFALFFWLYYSAQKSVYAAFVFGALWGVMELLREMVVFDFSWGHLGYALHNTPFIVLAAPLSVYGVSAFVVCVNFLFAQFLYAQLTKSEFRLRFTPLRAVVGVVLAANAYVLFFSPPAAPPPSSSASTSTSSPTPTSPANEAGLRVAVLNTALPLEESLGEKGFYTYVELLRSAAAASPPPRLVVAPESIFHPIEIDRETNLPVSYEDEAQLVGRHFDVLTALSREFGDTTFVFGFKTRDGAARYNSMVTMKNGALLEIYDKRVTLPFAERSESVHDGRYTGAITMGRDDASLSIEGYAINPYVCSEIIHPRIAKKNTDLAVSISNEDAFSGLLTAHQNHIMAKFRAAENEQYLLRAVKDGVSSIIDPRGNEVALAADKQTGVLFGTVYIAK